MACATDAPPVHPAHEPLSIVMGHGLPVMANTSDKESKFVAYGDFAYMLQVVISGGEGDSRTVPMQNADLTRSYKYVHCDAPFIKLQWRRQAACLRLRRGKREMCYTLRLKPLQRKTSRRQMLRCRASRSVSA